MYKNKKEFNKFLKTIDNQKMWCYDEHAKTI